MDAKCWQHLICLLLSLVWSTAARATRRNYRQLPTSPLTYAQYPSYSILEPNGPGTYAFGYEFEDPSTGNIQFRDEERLINGTVSGSYGYIRPDGKLTVTRFWADERGFNSHTQTYDRADEQTSYRPGNEPSQSSDENNSYEQPSLTPQDVDQILQEHNIDLYPTYNPTNDPDLLSPSVASLFGSKKPLKLQPRGGKDGLAVQFVNNFIPSNFPLVTFQTQIPQQVILPAETPSPVEDTNDSVDHTDFVNDKFHDPIFDERKDFVQKKPNIHRHPARWNLLSRYENSMRPLSKKTRKQQMQKQYSYPEASTKEALWFRDMIRSRRKEYVEKYSTNYNSYTIPASYLVSP